MNLRELIEQYGGLLNEFSEMSVSAGSRPNLTQGGGGNTSVKLDGRVMAIKASGFRLADVTPQSAYVLMDYGALRAYYGDGANASAADVEAAGSQAASQAIIPAEGLAGLRPSVEAGFHSLLDRFVLHTHPVYANLACCCAQGEQKISNAMSGADYPWAVLPYTNPGAGLTFAVERVVAQTRDRCGKAPSVIFLQNHGLIATHESVAECAALHEDACLRLAREFKVDMSEYPQPRIAPEGGLFVSATPFLSEELRRISPDMRFFVEEALYPDQLVYLSGELEIKSGGYSGGEAGPACTLYTGSGEAVYRCSQQKAAAIEEIMVAVLYIRKVLRENGCDALPMSTAGKQFIGGWESESYRKSVNA